MKGWAEGSTVSPVYVAYDTVLWFISCYNILRIRSLVQPGAGWPIRFKNLTCLLLARGFGRRDTRTSKGDSRAPGLGREAPVLGICLVDGAEDVNGLCNPCAVVVHVAVRESKRKAALHFQPRALYADEIIARFWSKVDKDSDTLLPLKRRSFLGYACDYYRYVDAQRLCPSPLYQATPTDRPQSLMQFGWFSRRRFNFYAHPSGVQPGEVEVSKSRMLVMR